MTAELSTGRLLLRGWRAADRAPFAALNADPEVMRHFPAPLDRAASDAFVDRIEAGFAEHGFGLWAVEHRETGTFLGFVGLSVPRFEASFTPCVEIGWRLARHAWGHGYATEAARRCLAFAFDERGLDEVVSFTAVTNAPSRAVMERIGMTYAGEFDHPLVADGSPLRRHVLYRVARPSLRPAPG